MKNNKNERLDRLKSIALKAHALNKQTTANENNNDFITPNLKEKIVFRLSIEEKKALKKIAFQKGLSISSFCRMIIKNQLY